MTRYARSGSTQQHKKMPGDATPWEEFSTAAKQKTTSKDDKLHRIQKGRIEKKKQDQKRRFKSEDSEKNEKLSKNEDFNNEVDGGSSAARNISTIDMQTSDSATKGLSKRQIQKAKRKIKIINRDIMRSQMADYEAERNEGLDFSMEEKPTVDEMDIADSKDIGKTCKVETSSTKDIGKVEKSETSNENNDSFQDGLSKRQLKRAKRKMKLQMFDKKASETSNDMVVKHKVEDVAESLQSSPTKFTHKKKPKRNKEIISENTVDASDHDDVIVDKKNIQEKSIGNTVGMLNNHGTSALSNDSNNASEVKPMTKNQWRKARIKRKFELLKAMQDKKVVSDNEEKEEMPDERTENHANKKAPVSSPEKDFGGKKKKFVEKLQRKKHQHGFPSLPSDVERNIYNIKKTMREKGMSGESIKEIIRKERRHEEIKFRRTFAKKPCFNCRQIGHLLSDCPLRLGDAKQATGICFKCGSTEHTSYKCTKRVEGYPLAKCFVCKETGHVSKDCPKNEHGVYIKGGKCSLCGNVNHLKKDCPTLTKDKEAVMTVDTINNGISVDAEIIKPETMPKNKFKKPKVVKF